MAETNKRIYSYDSMRALACLAIVLLHTVSTWKADTVLGAGYYSQDTLRMLWNQGLNALLVRWAVPVFFMLSGALMLNPDKHVTLVKIKQHVLKMLAVLLTFGWFYAVLELVVKSKGLTFGMLLEAFGNLCQQGSWAHLWFVYAIIGCYLVTPILRAWVATAESKEITCVTVLMVFLLSVVPSINFLLNSQVTSFGLTSLGAALLYYLLGHVLTRIRMTSRLVIGLCVAGGGLLFLTEVHGFAVHIEYSSPQFIWTVMYSSAIFYWWRSSSTFSQWGKNRYVAWLSKSSLCIYIVHPIFLNGLYKGLHFCPLTLPAGAGELAICAVALLFSVCMAIGINYIPGLRKIMF